MARTFLDKENEKYVDRRAAVDAIEAVEGVDAQYWSWSDWYMGRMGTRSSSHIGSVKVEAVEAVVGRDAIVGVSTQKERLGANWEAMKRTDNVLGPVTVNRPYTTSVENKYGTLGSIRGDGFEDKSQYQAGSNGEPNG